jgi:catechol 2,3-dioxygenase-like lactoylglutathione lyase family enzyme
MSHIRRFDHVGITVADLDAATQFFVALGLEIEGGRRLRGCRPRRCSRDGEVRRLRDGGGNRRVRGLLADGLRPRPRGDHCCACAAHVLTGPFLVVQGFPARFLAVADQKLIPLILELRGSGWRARGFAHQTQRGRPGTRHPRARRPRLRGRRPLRPVPDRGGWP